MPFEVGNKHCSNRKGKRKARTLAETIRSGIGAPLIMRALKEKILAGDMAAVRLASEFAWAKPAADYESALDELRELAKQQGADIAELQERGTVQ